MSNWKCARLGSLGTTFTGLAGKTKEDFGNGSPYIPYLNILQHPSIDPSQMDYVNVRPGENQSKVKYGDIFFTTSSETVEDVGMSSVLLHDLSNTYLNSFCFGFRPNNFDDLLPEFAAHLFRGEETRRAISYLGQGSTRYNISKTAMLKRIHLNLPTIPEQRRIVEILDTADEAIQKTEAVIAKLKQMKAGLLHDLLTRGIDENGELRPKNGEKQPLPVGEAPAEWVVEECERLCHSITVGIVVRPTQYYTTTGVPVLRSTNVTPNGISGSDLVFMSEESNLKMAKSMVRTGDVVTVRTGYPGTSCVVCEKYDRSNCVDILISRPTKELLPEFLAMWINSDFGKGQVLRQQTGLAQQHFNVGELKELLIAKPTPEEQRRIIDRMNAAKNRIDDENEELEKLKLVKAGLMNDLLTGKKRVVQSGPASV